MNRHLTRADLLTSFKDLSTSFEKALSQANELDVQFKQTLETSSARIEEAISTVKNEIATNNRSPLADQLVRFMEAVSKTNQSWQSALNQKDKGLRFRENFSDSLLVYVYGKVKSGKSSLGNYIAWGKTDNVDKQQQRTPKELQPTYFSEERTNVEGGDQAQEAEKNRSFRVGATEATSSIQGFKLPGLTWVDSPGLHSYNTENGDLADEYVDHADLILYTMSSGSPGRDTDLQEINELIGKGKEPIIIITGSDTTEEDWDEVNDCLITTPVMKPLSDRTAQQEYVLTALQKYSAATPKILSISAHFAALHPDNPEKMSDSGLSELFQVLRQVSTEEGVQLKRKTPLNNFNNFLKSCEQDLTPLQKLIDDFKSNVEATDRKLSNSITINVTQAKHILKKQIEEDIYTLQQSHGDNEAELNSALKDKQKKWADLLNNTAIEHISAVFSDVMDNFQQGVINTWSNTELTLPEYTVKRITDEIPVSYTRGTRSRNGGFGGLIGATFGALAGGPVGLAIGSAIGSFVGTATGKRSEVSTRTIELVVGDNLVDIQNKTTQIYAEALEEYFAQEASKIRTEFISKASSFINNVSQEIEETRNSLIALQDKTEKLMG